MHENSILSYIEELSNDNINKRSKEILECLKSLASATDRQIKNYLGYDEMNCVRPRITELIDSGHIREIGSVKCETTGKTVRLVQLYS